MKQSLKRVLATMLVLLLTLTFVPIQRLSTVAETELYYSHTMQHKPSQGDNTLDERVWNFSLGGSGLDELAARGIPFAIGDSAAKELVIKTTIDDADISKIIIEAAMGGGGDSTMSISLGGVEVATNVALSGSNTAYTYSFDGLRGELVITIKATVTGKLTYIKSIKLYTGERYADGVFYEYTLTAAPTAGLNTLGDLSWNFSMASNTFEAGGGSSRGASFLVASSAEQKLTVSTTIADTPISRVAIEASMGGGGDTLLSVTIGGQQVGFETAVTNANSLYIFNADNLTGELVITLKATISGRSSYLKSITLYTGTIDTPTKVNYHGHTYRCNHAGQSNDEAYVTAALNNGFTIMGFSDHVMLPWITYENNTRGQYRQAAEYYESIRSLQEKYDGQIDILLGYECEWALGGTFEPYYRYIIDNNVVDYLILGNHYWNFNTDTNRFILPNEATLDEQAHVRGYVDAAIEALESGLFSVFAHPELFFAEGYGYVKTFDDDMKDWVREMCEVALAEGVALELNHGYVGSMESRPVYTEFWNIVKEVGNTIVIGVDAHGPGGYNESTRQRVIDFANKIGLEITEDLGITRKEPVPGTATFLLEGQLEFDYEADIANAKAALTWDAIRGTNALKDEVAFELSLPTTLKYCDIAWTSSNTDAISETGVVTRLTDATSVTLTATITAGEITDTVTFTLTVLSASARLHLDLPDLLAKPSAWTSATMANQTVGEALVFSAGTTGTWYQNAKLALTDSVSIPRSMWDDVYLEYDFTVSGSGGFQLGLTYATTISNYTAMSMGQLMSGNLEGSSDVYHGSASGRFSLSQIAAYIDSQPDGGFGPIEKVSNDMFVLKNFTLWFEMPGTVVSFSTLRFVYGDEAELKTLTVQASNRVGGTVALNNSTPAASATAEVEVGETVSITAIANEGYTFTGWYNGSTLVSANATYQFTIDDDLTLTARFKRDVGDGFVIIIDSSPENDITEPDPEPDDFRWPADLPATWALEEVQSAIERGLVPADLQQNFGQPMSRLDFCRMAIAFVEVDSGMSIDAYLTANNITLGDGFTDCNDQNVLAAAALGIVNGVGNGSFNPNGSINRASAACMLARTATVLGNPLDDAAQTVYDDQDDIRSWANDAVNFVSAIKVMGSTSDSASVFSPNNNYTIEQSIVTFERMMVWLLG